MTELEYLEQKVEEHKQDYVAALTIGNCKDFGEYQRICGVIYGLNLAKIDIQDLRKKMDQYANE